jgi:DNA polymerase-4
VKVKWADFQNTTRSRTLAQVVASRAQLHGASLALMDSVLPASKGIRLVGVTLSGFPEQDDAGRGKSWLLLEPDAA